MNFLTKVIADTDIIHDVLHFKAPVFLGYLVRTDGVVLKNQDNGGISFETNLFLYTNNHWYLSVIYSVQTIMPANLYDARLINEYRILIDNVHPVTIIICHMTYTNSVEIRIV